MIDLFECDSEVIGFGVFIEGVFANIVGAVFSDDNIGYEDWAVFIVAPVMATELPVIFAAAVGVADNLVDDCGDVSDGA